MLFFNSCKGNTAANRRCDLLMLTMAIMIMTGIQSTYAFHIPLSTKTSLSSSSSSSTRSFTNPINQFRSESHQSNYRLLATLPPNNINQSSHSRGSSTTILFSTKRNENNSNNYKDTKKRSGHYKRRKKPQNNSVAIRWVVESIEKNLVNERKSTLKRNIEKSLTYDRKTKLNSNDNCKTGDGDDKQSQVSLRNGLNTQNDDRILMDALCQIYQGE